jgi:hypothetical protein
MVDIVFNPLTKLSDSVPGCAPKPNTKALDVMAEKKERNAYEASMVTVMFCAMASIIIVLIALIQLRQITDGGMWAIALMALAPTILGIGVCFFIHSTASKIEGHRSSDVSGDNLGS